MANSVFEVLIHSLQHYQVFEDFFLFFKTPLSFLLLRFFSCFFFCYLICLLILYPIVLFLYWAHGNQGQTISSFIPQHQSKQNTMTMGGVGLLIVILLGALIFCDFRHSQVICYGCLVSVSFALLGFFDDWIKLTKKKNAGLSPRAKLVWQFFISMISSVYFFLSTTGFSGPNFIIPLFDFRWQAPVFFWFFWSTWVTMGSTNAVNIADGLDGLAAGVALICWMALAVIFCLLSQGFYLKYHYLNLVSVFDAQEVFVWSASFIAACSGFLHYNSFPAKVFMGDVGSSFLGGIMGWICIIFQIEFLWALIGIVYVVDILSNILQSSAKKILGRKIFPITPVHHSLELIFHETIVTKLCYGLTIFSSFIVFLIF